MQQPKWMFSGLVLIILAAGLFVSTPSKTTPKKENPPTCCKKPDKTCPGKKNAGGELIMEHLSREFISISPLTR